MHDVIVVGARCAGASTAMLLAHRGYKVLLADRATFPSDLPHGHFIHRHGPARLARWGVLDRLKATNCPSATAATFDFGDFPLSATGLAVDGIALGYGPRRTVFDKLLVDAAVEAGAELREAFTVDGFITQGRRIAGIRGRTRTGAAVTESAAIVVGADGRNSRLARFVGAREYDKFPPLTCWYFGYWNGAAHRGLELYVRRDKAILAFPTNAASLAVFVGWPASRLPEIRQNIEHHFMAAVDEIPEFSARVRAGRREDAFKGATDLPNFFRKPYGPGWALVGDAGCHKDPILGLGMCDAFRDVELLVDALEQGLSGRRAIDDALSEYEKARNLACAADYWENLHLARFQPPSADVYELRAALRGNPQATHQFFLAFQGMIPRESFFNTTTLESLGLGAAACAALLPDRGAAALR